MTNYDWDVILDEINIDNPEEKLLYSIRRGKEVLITGLTSREARILHLAFYTDVEKLRTEKADLQRTIDAIKSLVGEKNE